MNTPDELAPEDNTPLDIDGEGFIRCSVCGSIDFIHSRTHLTLTTPCRINYGTETVTLERAGAETDGTDDTLEEFRCASCCTVLEQEVKTEEKPLSDMIKERFLFVDVDAERPAATPAGTSVER